MKNIFSLICLMGAQLIQSQVHSQDQWPVHGLNHAETRHSNLEQINRTNVEELGLAWYFETGSTRGLEATPLVIDKTIFFTGTWSKVFANDAVTGEPLWEFDPKVPRYEGANACCDVVNRGVAAWEDSIFFGTIERKIQMLFS